MAFWKENTVSPKRQYRFQVQFGRVSDGGSISPSQAFWWAKGVNIPNFTVNPVEHHYLDNKYNFPGRTTWEDVEMTLVDPSDPDAVSIINDMLRKSGYLIKGESDTPATIGKIKAAQVNCVITALNEDGGIIETWTLNNCFVLSANLGSYEYSSDELRELTVTLKYDWATCEVDGQTYFPPAT
jgi:hypothetical protein